MDAYTGMPTMSSPTSFEKIVLLNACMAKYGYRAPVREDIRAGLEIYEVHVPHYDGQDFDRSREGCMRIRLDNTPLERPDASRDVVHYLVLMLSGAVASRVSLAIFTAFGYRLDGDNEVRFVKKI